MISEGSCDTEDWSTDAENSALITEINDILKDINRKKLFKLQYNFTVFYSNKCSLLQKHT